jgi:hypothetical protein
MAPYLPHFRDQKTEAWELVTCLRFPSWLNDSNSFSPAGKPCRQHLTGCCPIIVWQVAGCPKDCRASLCACRRSLIWGQLGPSTPLFIPEGGSLHTLLGGGAACPWLGVCGQLTATQSCFVSLSATPSACLDSSACILQLWLTPLDRVPGNRTCTS